MRTRTLLVAATLLGLPLAACGADDDGGGDGSVPAITGGGERTTTAEPTAAASATPTGDASTAAPTDATAAPTDDGALAAITLAEQEVGGTAFELDREDDDDQGWEVSVAVGGEEVDVDVNREGTEVLRTDGGDDLDDDDRTALDGAAITLADAVRTALDELDGPLEDVELDEEQGTVVWQVGIGDDAEVHVELATGAVLTVDRG